MRGVVLGGERVAGGDRRAVEAQDGWIERALGFHSQGEQDEKGGGDSWGVRPAAGGGGEQPAIDCQRGEWDERRDARGALARIAEEEDRHQELARQQEEPR